MFIMVDVEADGPAPGLYSMVSFGAVAVTPSLDKTFYGQCSPISSNYQPEALKVSGHTREECLAFPHPEITMRKFEHWLNDLNVRRPIFIADNNGFDWQFINYYFHAYLGYNPFGFSSQNLGSLYKGFQKNVFGSFKHLRITKHTHHPVDDAKGNAEALLKLEEMGLKIGK
jgi:DNA polymerase III epsilon subunit-like protein